MIYHVLYSIFKRFFIKHFVVPKNTRIFAHIKRTFSEHPQFSHITSYIKAHYAAFKFTTELHRFAQIT